MNVTGNICPVCGYDDMEFPYGYGEICSCCGTMFGETDADTSHPELTHRWIMKRAKWFSRYVHPPRNWSPYRQLLNINYTPTVEEAEALGIVLPTREGEKDPVLRTIGRRLLSARPVVSQTETTTWTFFMPTERAA